MRSSLGSSSENDPLLREQTGLTEDTNSSSFNDDEAPDDSDNDHDEGSGSAAASFWLADAKDTVRLSLPIFLATLSWVGMKTTDTALLGHISSDALSAAALSDLWTMCTQMFVQAPGK
jgi:Na+-driven multidrug efflux pump